MRLGAALMLVPKAPVHLNDLAQPREYEVWSSGEIVHMEAIPEAHPMNEPPNNHFRSRILAADAPHVFGALAGSNPVHRFQCLYWGSCLAAIAALTISSASLRDIPSFMKVAKDFSALRFPELASESFMRFWIFSPIT